MDVKIFSKKLQLKPGFFFNNQDDVDDNSLEADINQWLTDNPDIEVVHVKQTQSGGSWRPAILTLSVWFTRHA